VRYCVYQTVADDTGETRKIAKGPGVAYFYGSAPGRWEPVLDRKGNPVFREDGTQKYKPGNGMIKEAIKFLKAERLSTKNITKRIRAIDKALKRTIPKADEAKRFIRKIAGLYGAAGKTMTWETLMPVLNYYYEPITRRHDTVYRHQRKTVTYIEGYDTDKVIPKGRTAAPPNLIHSLDGAHMHLVALAAEREGITMVGVHDAFSCLTSRARRFHQIIGEQFRDLHKRDWLADILAAAHRELPADCSYRVGCCTVRLANLKLPEKGTLNLDDVPLSFFAYS
jgi:DNA-directed RNA polymerase